ncbi:MAG: hypothetical protein E7351_00815 [Clostridiales bacterium]|nr:hypothetical protein [Clostridiales bacterium]
MKILSLKVKSKNNPNIFIAETDGGEVELHSEVIVKYGVGVGEIDDKDFVEYVDDSAEIIGANLCMKYISSRLKTEKQIKDYLYKKSYTTRIINRIIEKLKNYSVIDDSEFADSYIRSNQNFSKNKLKQKLASFGVGASLIEEKLTDVDDMDSCVSHAEKFLRGKMMTREVKEKLYRKLVNLGFGYDVIKRVINKFDFEEE